MNIYRIRSNYKEFKFFVFSKEEEDTNIEFDGQSLKEKWRPIKFEIFCDKRKKKDNRREDFDASCYYDGILLVNKKTKDIINERINDYVEILPVITDRGDFFFVNVINKIKSIKDIDRLTIDAVMEMERNNNYIFDYNQVKGEMIFRDNQMSFHYFVTENFITLMDEHQINGLKYELAGYAI
jgi:hypothetical protein